MPKKNDKGGVRYVDQSYRYNDPDWWKKSSGKAGKPLDNVSLEDIEKINAAISLLSTGASFSPAAPIAAPIRGASALLGAGIDTYQAARSLKEGKYGDALYNTLTAGVGGLNALGAKNIGALANTKADEVGGMLGAGTDFVDLKKKTNFATGGQMRNATNSQFVPSYVNGVPVYGFGSWLGKNAGNLLQVAGGVGAMFIPGAQGVGVSMIASGAGGIAGQAVDDKNQKADEAEQRAEAEKQFMLNQYNDSQQYFTNGGMIPSMSRGGFMEGLKFYNDGGNLDNVTNFPVGGTHETNPRGGIPLGNNALVEEGEYVYNFPKQGKYVFSNRY